MKVLALPLFLVVGLAGFAFAQTEKPITKWVLLDKPDEEFSLEVPAGFEYRNPSFPTNSARGEFHSDSERFYIFIDIPKEPDQRKQVEAFVRYAHPIESDIKISGSDFRRAEFEDPSGFYHRIILVETPSRVFTLQTVSRSKNTEHADRFLNSFRLQAKSLPDDTTGQRGLTNKPDSEADLSTETATPIAVQPGSSGGGMGSGNGSGSGSGSGTGSGTGSGAGIPPSTQPKITAPLRVTYKQKASYTDFARFYGIQGTVTLRVTFLASGEIGSVTTIQRQPFGLTETAIHAAKQMKFEPEMVNGVARTTTRPVSFSFAIY